MADTSRSQLLSRRALFALGGAAAVGAVTAWRRRSRPARGGSYPPLPPLASGARHVVLLSIDGLRPSDVLHPPEGLAIPNLRRLLTQGAAAEGARSVWPTVTYPAHATIVTGVDPVVHGVATNYEWDPLGRLGSLGRTDEAWVWKASSLRSPALWDAARARGLRVGSSYWPVTVGASIDFLCPQIWKTKTNADDELLRSLTVPAGLPDELLARGLSLPAEHRTDRERADAAIHILRSRRPELMLVYLTDLDTASHLSGASSPEARAVLSRIDGHLGRIETAVNEAGAARETTFVIVSDHGFADVTTTVRPAVWLREAGLLDVGADGQVTGYRAALQPAGGLAGIVLANKDDTETGRKVIELFENAARDPANFIARVHRGDDIRNKGGFPDAHVVLEAQAPASFGSGPLGPRVGPNQNRGSHGYPPEDPRMLATLILSGAQIRPGASTGIVSLRDVAPTIAHLLGIDFPTARGRVISELLTA